MSSRRQHAPKNNYLRRWGFGLIPIGVFAGAAIGAVFGNIFIGLAIGAGLGVGIGVALIAASMVWQ
jgi:hypothetical protein